jgi:hypothetical protein
VSAWGQLSTHPAWRPGIRRALAAWPTDPNLAGVRDPAELARLPEAERAAWQRLWDDVAALAGSVGGAE